MGLQKPCRCQGQQQLHQRDLPSSALSSSPVNVRALSGTLIHVIGTLIRGFGTVFVCRHELQRSPLSPSPVPPTCKRFGRRYTAQYQLGPTRPCVHPCMHAPARARPPERASERVSARTIWAEVSQPRRIGAEADASSTSASRSKSNGVTGTYLCGTGHRARYPTPVQVEHALEYVRQRHWSFRATFSRTFSPPVLASCNQRRRR